ncbi:hypothetical protein HYQ46_013172 [Verticillium longisporum]|uniref:Uncharacterized protein n=1 Tax=Verticillium dahliae TaxID=27337 RepID=A0A444RNZ4_VERDA|nr:hypothetical protein HYQ46_013172 [Verticillium longisporum]PNH43482.1 hypothetical protein VD0004_g4015 [Verticillium dahliae]PNH72391.1 hypothetical protein VD0001_g5129 [Verticillium dahliae]RXG42848.1 hypothetical protein VDGE_30571 [Verticillium dahliae]
MAGEIERLIEWLIDDISCHGDRGYPVSQTLATIQDYHHGTVRHDTPSAIMPAAAESETTFPSAKIDNGIT